MNLRTILIEVVPALSAAQDSGSYQPDMGARAVRWATAIGRQAMREGRDAVDAVTALLALGGADDFERQQLGLTASLLLCDDLLTLVASNAPPEFEPREPERTVDEVIADIERRTRAACNVLAVPPNGRRAMFAAGAELERAVAREISSGIRGTEHAAIARVVHEQIAEVATCPIRRRDDHADRAVKAMIRLAA